MLPKEMRAVVAYAKGDYRYTTVETPRPKGKELILEIEACGVCAGDIKCYEQGFRFWGGEGNPAYCEPPFIPGHELLGHVAETGPDYNGPFRIGDRITSEQLVPCGHCRYCKEGNTWLCDPHNVYGFKSSLNGGFAEYVRLPENAVNHRVPDELPVEIAILIEPYACAMHAVEKAEIQKDDVVMIAGAGTLGLGMITIASQKKPRALISIEPVPRLRALAKAMGATHTMDALRDQNIPEWLLDMTAQTGCDVYIEASGHPSAISQGLRLIKKGGRFIEFSVFSGPTSIDWSIIGDAKELDIMGSSLSPHCFSKVINGLEKGLLQSDGVVTHTLPLSQFRKAFELSINREGIKIVLIP